MRYTFTASPSRQSFWRSGRLRGPARGDGGEPQARARRVPRSGSTVRRSLDAMDVGTRSSTPRRLREDLKPLAETRRKPPRPWSFDE